MKKRVYKTLHEKYLIYQNQDEVKSDLIADLLDFVVGWCAPSKKIWDNDEGGFDRTLIK